MALDPFGHQDVHHAHRRPRRRAGVVLSLAAGGAEKALWLAGSEPNRPAASGSVAEVRLALRSARSRLVSPAPTRLPSAASGPQRPANLRSESCPSSVTSGTCPRAMRCKFLRHPRRQWAAAAAAEAALSQPKSD
eukprot:CAMPEP_0181212052 /NCGR_PEP_ID=MMETSP1096-20121128/24135_1 /TAXON_ID=156174 ORGANISM="Chrysochromulina ericina, Strain CCMP281" /NCGR_SAMPLE_ID=MMETSP1096 /ASSEMBLY_ACC=CAM_ASM_000453 /LENGTH=134 /DNA_ID=CAMNT_0023303537 /DNA_START=197 /DNA_END=602 /DNA_ORIENTATION=-